MPTSHEPSREFLRRYRILEKLGIGSTGVLYRAVEIDRDRPVAIRFLPAADPATCGRIVGQGRALVRLDHPGLARVHDAGEDDGHPFAVYELVDGVGLTVILEQGNLGPEAAATLVCQLLDGLDHAHRAGVLARDVRTGNLVLRADGVVKLVDFGLSRDRGPESPVAYWAPEQLAGPIDLRSDLYSAGVVLFELASGRLPIEAPTVEELVSKIRTAAPPPLSSVCPGVGIRLDRIVSATLSRSPDERPPDAAALASAIREAVGQAALDTGKKLVSKRFSLVARPQRPAGGGRAGRAASAMVHGRPVGRDARGEGEAPGEDRARWIGALVYAAMFAALVLAGIWFDGRRIPASLQPVPASPTESVSPSAILSPSPELTTPGPSRSVSSPVAPPPSRGANHIREVFPFLGRNGCLTVSMESGADQARTPPNDRSVQASVSRRVCLRPSLPGDADYFRGLRLRTYGPGFKLADQRPDPAYATLPPSADGGDAVVASNDLVVDHLGAFLRHADLSASGDPAKDSARYLAQRGSFLRFLRAHLVHRFATGLVPPVLLSPARADRILPRLFDATRQNARSVDFVRPAGIASCGTDWTIEFLFQKRASWPEIDRVVVQKSGGTCSPSRYKTQPDYAGFWVCPAPFVGQPPAGVDPADCDRFSEEDWERLKASGFYDVRVCLSNQAFDVNRPESYSTLWGPSVDDSSFCPGHQRADLATLTGNLEDPWFQYQCQVLVRSAGKIDGKPAGPFFYSDIFHVEHYLSTSTVPPSLEEARRLHGEPASVDPVPDSVGSRRIDAPDEVIDLFESAPDGNAGTPDALARPRTFYPPQDRDLGPALPPAFSERISVHYRTGAGTRHLIRFPEKGVHLPGELPAACRELEGYRAFLDKYYTRFAIYYPPVVIDGVTMGPWIVDAEDVPAAGTAHPYAPHFRMPDTSGCWKSVYQPTRFPEPLAACVDYLMRTPQGLVLANYGTDRVPGGFRFALKGSVNNGRPMFEVPLSAPDYRLRAGALPVPVGCQTVHGKLSLPGRTRVFVAGADALLANPGRRLRGHIEPFQELARSRDSRVYACVTPSATGSGTVSFRLIDKVVAFSSEPRANLILTIARDEASRSRDATVERLGLWHDVSLSTGMPPLPYGLASVESRMPPGFAHGFCEMNQARIAWSDRELAPFLTDAAGKNVLVTQHAVQAGVPYRIEVEARPGVGPQMVEMDPAGRSTPGQLYLYHWARSLTVDVYRTRTPGDRERKVASFFPLPPPIAGGPLAGLSTRPPIATGTVTWPEAGDHEVVARFVDSNLELREIVYRVVVK